MHPILSTIERGRIIAILRGDFHGRETDIVAALLAAGITAVEITFNSTDALGGIARVARRFSGAMAVGAGTVLSVEDVRRAADAGARFIVSPNRNCAVIAETKRRGMVSLPGCFTPSEMIEALDAGADALKLFPAVALGVAFVKALRGPLPAARLVPTGGVNPESLREYLAAGAWAAGIGSELVGKDILAPGQIEMLPARAAAFVAATRPA